MNVKDPTSRLMRWSLKLEEYDYEIQYQKGRLNSNAHALSRRVYHLQTPEEEFQEYVTQYRHTQLQSLKEVLRTRLPIITIGPKRNDDDIIITAETEPKEAFAKLKGHLTSDFMQVCYDLRKYVRISK